MYVDHRWTDECRSSRESVIIQFFVNEKAKGKTQRKRLICLVRKTLRKPVFQGGRCQIIEINSRFNSGSIVPH